MKILKGFALSVLSILLFLSLVVFGLAFNLHSTVLNPNFVAKAIIIEAITGVEPAVKEQLDAAIYPVYDYLSGKSQNIDLASTLHNTFLNSTFVTSFLDNLELGDLINETNAYDLMQELTEQQSGEEADADILYLSKYIDDIVIDLEPWIKEQAAAVSDPLFDYLLGESAELNIVISLEPVQTILDDKLKQDFLNSPPAELANLSSTELEQYYDDHFGDLQEIVPSTLTIDQTVIGADVPQEIAKNLSDVESALQQPKQYISYFQLGYWLLIVLILVLTACIVLIYRQVKNASRHIGIILLFYGALEFTGIFIANSYINKLLTETDVAIQFQPWLHQLLNSFLSPLFILCIVSAVIGTALIVLSFLYKRYQTS
jgi:hypothetical protein